MTRMIQLLPVTLRWKLPQLVTLLRSCSQKNGDVQVCESEERSVYASTYISKVFVIFHDKHSFILSQ